MKLKFSLTINCDTAAFDFNCPGEIARLLRDAAGRIEWIAKDGPVVDAKGNTVGEYRFTKESEL